MKCPFCDHPDSKVIDSRPTEEGGAIRRRRECIYCNNRFTTYEKIETMPMIVVKNDTSREPYDRQKLLKGIMHACVKRPVPMAEVEKIVNTIEAALSNSLKREIASREIGKMVMEQLKKTDEIAYVRFASVYRKFQDVDMFREEINKLLK